MRAAFVRTVTKLLDENPKVVLLLGDISVHAFKEARDKHPLRVLNVGINEQAMVGMAAGLARAGMYPIVHTIAPFLVERAFEQLKIDFGYQGLAGCFVSVGASYDYATMGCTHHCPGDVALMLTIPGMEVYVPGDVADVEELLPKIADGACAYVRLSEDFCEFNRGGTGTPAVQKSDAIVLGVGPLRHFLPMDTRIVVVPLVRVDDLSFLRSFWIPPRILVLEPFYAGTLTHLVQEAIAPLPASILSVGVPRRFLKDYGTRKEFDAECGFTRENIATQLEILIRG